MFFLAATMVGWTGGDSVYRKVAAKNVRLLLVASLLILGYDANASSNYTHLDSGREFPSHLSSLPPLLKVGPKKRFRAHNLAAV